MNYNSTFSRSLVLGAIGVVVLLVLNAGLTYRSVRQLNEDARWVVHTHEVMDSLEELLGTLRDAETGQRGYLLTREDRYLDPYNEARKSYEDRIERVRRLTEDNQSQQDRIAKLRELAVGRMKSLARTLAMFQQSEADAALKVVKTGEGKRLMESIRDLVDEMEDEERDLLVQRNKQTDRTYSNAVATGLVTALLGLLAVGMFLALLGRHLGSRQRAAALIHDQRQLLYATLTSIGDAVIATDSAAQVTFLNSAAQRLTGWTQKEAEGQPLDVVFHIVNEETRQKVENPALRALREGAIVGLANHTILIAKDGSEWPIDDSASPIRSEGGTVSGAVLVFRDGTDRRQGERRLRESEERFRMLADNIPQLAWIADAGTEGQVHWFNRNWFEYTGTTLEEMKGSGWHSVHHPDHAERVIRKFTRHVHQGLDWEDTFPLRGKDGQYRWFLSRMKCIRDESGTVVQIFGTNTDISEQQRTASELRRLAAELSEADRRKDEFLATLAHELRNPLAPLRNGLQVMKLASHNGESVEQVRSMMERQLGQMVHLIDDLLDLSRISRGKVELRKEPMQLAAAVQQAVEISRPAIEQMGHELMIDVPTEPIVVDADPTRLAQVISNLLNNAAKFTEKGGRVRLAVERQDGEAVVSVRDTGVGIPVAMLPKVFEIFTQVHRSIDRSQGGLGIGLSLVKGLVEMHGGSVEARSEGPGKGSEFVVRLPVVVETSAPRTTRGVEEPTALPSSLRILIVDDNRDGADSLALMLRIKGHDTRTAYDGLEGMAVAEAYRPELVLLDIGLPKLNGYEACRRIREQPWGKNVILIAVTGWGQDEDRRRSQEAGFDHHLVKPVDPQTLMTMLAGLHAAKA